MSDESVCFILSSTIFCVCKKRKKKHVASGIFIFCLCASSWFATGVNAHLGDSAWGHPSSSSKQGSHMVLTPAMLFLTAPLPWWTSSLFSSHKAADGAEFCTGVLDKFCNVKHRFQNARLWSAGPRLRFSFFWYAFPGDGNKFFMVSTDILETGSQILGWLILKINL